MSESLNTAVNVDAAEVARFQAAASRWWDPEGEMRPLHDLNPVRLGYVERAGSLAGRAVVDVGCGGGILSESMAGLGAHVTGIDLGDKAAEYLRLLGLAAYLVFSQDEVKAWTWMRSERGE